MPRTYTSPPVTLGEGLGAGRFYRADLRLHGVDHSGATYEGRVFLNNPQANESTPTELAAGYAGSFYVFGHGGCYGDEGHCEVVERAPGDPRGPHPLTPTEAVVDITDGLRQAIGNTREIRFTVVPVIMSANELTDVEDPLKFARLEVQAYQTPGQESETSAAVT